jgi:hypothetical protein
MPETFMLHQRAPDYLIRFGLIRFSLIRLGLIRLGLLATIAALAACTKPVENNELNWAHAALERNPHIKVIGVDATKNTLQIRVKATGETLTVTPGELVAMPIGDLIALTSITHDVIPATAPTPAVEPEPATEAAPPVEPPAAVTPPCNAKTAKCASPALVSVSKHINQARGPTQTMHRILTSPLFATANACCIWITDAST